MGHTQFESLLSGGKSTPDFTDNNLLRQVQLETEIKKTDTGVVPGLARVGTVAAGGIKDAGMYALENYQEYAPQAATGLGIGLGLGAVARAGKFGPHAAAAAGTVMGAMWIKDEITSGRWTGFADAIIDSYNSPLRLEENRLVAQRSLGTFMVDTAVMIPTAGVGFGAGYKFAPEGWGARAIKGARTGAVELASSLRMSERGLLPQRVSVEPNMMTRRNGTSSTMDLVEGRSFAGGDKSTTTTGDVFADAAKLVRGKKTYDGLAALTEAVVDQRVAKDGKAIEFKSQIEQILEQHQQNAARRQQVDQQIKALERQRTELEHLTPETRALESAQGTVQSILEARQKLPQLQSELRSLEPKKGKGEQGQPAPEEAAIAGQENPQARASRLRQEIKDTPTEADLTQARARVHQAQQTLEARQGIAPGEIARINSEIEAAGQVRDQLTASTDFLTAQMTEAMRGYNARVQALKEGLAEFEPVAEVTTPVQPGGQGKGRQGSKSDTRGSEVQTANSTEAAGTAAVVEGPRGSAADALVKGPAENTVAPAAETAVGTSETTTAGSGTAPNPEVVTRDVVARGTGERVAETTVEVPVRTATLLRNIETTLADAQAHSKAFENQRLQRQADRTILEIEHGRRKFPTAEAKEAALEQARVKKAAAEVGLDGNPPKYAQTLKKLHDYTKAVEAYYKAETVPAKRDAALRDAVKTLEELMMPIDNIWNGIPGKTTDLPRPGSTGQGGRPLWPEERLPQIQRHLEAKINTVDGAQAARVGAVKDNVAFAEVLRLQEAGELPADGSIIFFTKEGVLLYQSELKVNPRQNQRGRDPQAAQRHAENTPAFIDVARLERGLGPEGAGLWRFIGQENRITGAAILRPVMKDGKPVALPNARNGKGEPMVKKEVERVIGEVPQGVTANMAYGHLLNTMKMRRAASQQGAVEGTLDATGGSTAPGSQSARVVLENAEGAK